MALHNGHGVMYMFILQLVDVNLTGNGLMVNGIGCYDAESCTQIHANKSAT